MPENVNEAIRAARVRAVFPDGTIEVMPTLAAVRRAQAFGLDLVLIAPAADPPIAKAMRYDQSQSESKRNQGPQ
jgi:translation initiation factor IF-3